MRAYKALYSAVVIVLSRRIRCTSCVVTMASKRKSDDAEGSSAKKVKADCSLDEVDFSSKAKNPSRKQWNLKISSWNINGLRAWLGKSGTDYILKEDPDIFCLQETKCSKSKIPPECNVDGYHVYWLDGDKDGYSGVGLYSKKKPIDVKYGIGVSDHDNEGRVITAEYSQFYLVTAYVPNSGRGLVRLQYRTQEWDVEFRKYLKKLDANKPVILCGDLNVAHKEIDLKNPKTNKKTAGFTPEERQEFSKLLDENKFVDTFRHLYPDKKEVYSFWTYMMNARAKNTGWRLDYFVVSQSLLPKVCDSIIRTDVYGSDHCPVVLLLHV